MESTHREGPGAQRGDRPVQRPARASLPEDAARLAAAGGTAHLAPDAAAALQRAVGNAAFAAAVRRDTPGTGDGPGETVQRTTDHDTHVHGAGCGHGEAVQRTTDHDTHVHGAGCGHGAAVQRSTVPDVLRSAGRPLDDSVRADMESRLGADFSDVRVHTDAAAKVSAAEVGARAYTSGSHVVIGEGGADRHTLAHELTHVIQQRKGPVAGTDDGSGLKVSDPSDRFEREAEANATRALSGPAPVREPGTAIQSAPAPLTPGTDAPVQRLTEDEKADCVRLEAELEGVLAQIPQTITRHAQGDHPGITAVQQVIEGTQPEMGTPAERITAVRNQVTYLRGAVTEARPHLDQIARVYTTFGDARLAAHDKELRKLAKQAWASSTDTARKFFLALDGFRRAIQSTVVSTSAEMQQLRAESGGRSAEEVGRLFEASMVRIKSSGSAVYYASDYDSATDAFGGAWGLEPTAETGKLQWINAWELHIHGKAERGADGEIVGFTTLRAHIKPSKNQHALGVSIQVSDQQALRQFEAAAGDRFVRWAATDVGKATLRKSNR
ncbi:DUF4157 domain-containing protein [Streptomyces sp. E-08]|uniref:eCIS core domain-containing protein n=1 Tax=Streptomyces sp. E-08 TaxID=3404047 RepID=UPI003CF1292F